MYTQPIARKIDKKKLPSIVNIVFFKVTVHPAPYDSSNREPERFLIIIHVATILKKIYFLVYSLCILYVVK
jgi:hypothetical protein